MKEIGESFKEARETIGISKSEVIKDYVDFETTTKRLVTEIKALENENAKLQAEIRNLKASLDIAGSNKGVTNVDLLKRISDLEKVVYGE